MGIVQQTPGVYREDVFPARRVPLPTGVPAFLGLGSGDWTLYPPSQPQKLTLATQLAGAAGPARPEGYLAQAVAGFFGNGGEQCWVVRLDERLAPEKALAAGLAALDPLPSDGGLDLVAVPDLFVLAGPGPSGLAAAERMQSALLAHCDALGDRFALLDSLPGAGVDDVIAQRNTLSGTNGALYFPWLRIAGDPRPVPPSGHVAGIVARSDGKTGVHKAPANEVVVGAVDLTAIVSDTLQASLNPIGVNAIRAFPGRGIRVWGARTLSREDAWTYINVRRLFLTAIRWIEQNLGGVAFEPNDPKLWTRIGRELRVYFEGLFRAGALKGKTAAEAFYVKCDAETNPPEVRDAGRVVTEIGLAPAIPNEFVVVRIIHGVGGVGGVTLQGPSPGA